MKKLLLSVILIFAAGILIPVFASEIEEDYLDIAANYCIMGDYQTAMEYLDKILTINPDNRHVKDLKKGLTHVMTKDKQTFITNVNPLIKTSQLFKQQGDDLRELSALTKATEGKNAYLAYYYLGNFYRSKQDYVKALDAYNASTSARADFAQAYLSSAVVCYESGKYQSAINSVDKYLTFVENDDLAYAIKSRSEFELGLLDEAKRDNDKAIELNDCPEYQFDRAKILYKYEKYQDSKKLFATLLKDISNSKIYEYMGLCDYAMQNYTSALFNIDKAIILSDDDEYLNTLYNDIKKILENKRYEETEIGTEE